MAKNTEKTRLDKSIERENPFADAEIPPLNKGNEYKQRTGSARGTLRPPSNTRLNLNGNAISVERTTLTVNARLPLKAAGQLHRSVARLWRFDDRSRRRPQKGQIVATRGRARSSAREDLAMCPSYSVPSFSAFLL
jgi:hypothetical protein